jgi:hypothetical protein
MRRGMPSQPAWGSRHWQGLTASKTIPSQRCWGGTNLRMCGKKQRRNWYYAPALRTCVILGFIFSTGLFMDTLCQHLATLDIHHLRHDTQHICPECVAMGDTWVHLRICQQCGHVGCCDQSKNKHATKHFHTTQHPVMTSAQPGERWAWCYVDEEMAEY